jgi:hypothetical protein
VPPILENSKAEDKETDTKRMCLEINGVLTKDFNKIVM